MNRIRRRCRAGHRTRGIGARASVLAALALTTLAVGASPAAADGLATVRGCLSGKYGPHSEVASWDVGSHHFRLFCGDHTKGVIHIDDGHGPLDVGNTDSLFLNCLDKIFIYGDSSGAGSVPNSTVWQMKYRRPHGLGSGTALALVDNHSGQILTAYPIYENSRDWRGCNDGTPA